MKDSKTYTIKPITTDEIKKYDDNLQILEDESFFDENNKTITIRFPVPNDRFEPIGVRPYDVSSEKTSAILYAISDGTNLGIQGKKMAFMFEGTFSMDILNGSQVNNGKLVLIAYTDNVDFVGYDELKALRGFVETQGDQAGALLCAGKTVGKLNMARPKEACGGIIFRR